MKKNGILTLLFAFIPGAGQMYQGYMKRGLSLVLMAAAIGMASALIPPVVFTLLVVFMYSFFDTFNLRAQISMGTAPEDDYLVHFDLPWFPYGRDIHAYRRSREHIGRTHSRYINLEIHT